MGERYYLTLKIEDVSMSSLNLREEELGEIWIIMLPYLLIKGRQLLLYLIFCQSQDEAGRGYIQNARLGDIRFIPDWFCKHWVSFGTFVKLVTLARKYKHRQLDCPTVKASPASSDDPS